MPDQLSERDKITLFVLALLEGTTVAEQRRRGLHAFAQAARQDADVAEIVRLILAAQRVRDHGASNVVTLPGCHS